ncbi:High Affinity Nerve Growth Factor Receptor [Manis pentadactyla]|nr:High Affinity Nerve Growth Factor Receptor [Manis pentadactyla]
MFLTAGLSERKWLCTEGELSTLSVLQGYLCGLGLLMLTVLTDLLEQGRKRIGFGCQTCINSVDYSISEN